MLKGRTRSYRHIMHTISSFCLSVEFDSGSVSSGYYKFKQDNANNPAKVGDLAVLQAAPASDWTFSWIIEIDRSDEKRVGARYLMESILTGERVWWGNVSVLYLDRYNLAPHWRWSDRQWKFCDRWLRSCSKNYHSSSSLLVGCYPRFNPDNSVTLIMRKKWSCGEPNLESTYPDWKKVTLKIMADVIQKMDEV